MGILCLTTCLLFSGAHGSHHSERERQSAFASRPNQHISDEKDNGWEKTLNCSSHISDAVPQFDETARQVMDAIQEEDDRDSCASERSFSVEDHGGLLKKLSYVADGEDDFFKENQLVVLPEERVNSDLPLPDNIMATVLSFCDKGDLDTIASQQKDNFFHVLIRCVEENPSQFSDYPKSAFVMPATGPHTDKFAEKAGYYYLQLNVEFPKGQDHGWFEYENRRHLIPTDWYKKSDSDYFLYLKGRSYQVDDLGKRETGWSIYCACYRTQNKVTLFGDPLQPAQETHKVGIGSG